MRVSVLFLLSAINSVVSHRWISRRPWFGLRGGSESKEEEKGADAEDAADKVFSPLSPEEIRAKLATIPVFATMDPNGQPAMLKQADSGP